MLQPRDLRPFRKQLLRWFREFQRDLPLRRTKDPYRIWLSDIMLQQTRVAAVIPYYQRFLERFPDIHALATAPQEEVLRLWSGLGYYSRARNLHRAAQQMLAKHGGAFPRDTAQALELSGIGQYTAAAILSIAYGTEHAVLDGNVARVLARIFAVRGDLRDTKRWQGLQTQADALLDPKFPGDWNQAMMELGATLCTPRAPQCLLCPVAHWCRAHALGIALRLPAARRKPKPVRLTLSAAILLDPRGRTLLLRQKSDHSGLFSNLWQFPAVKAAGPAPERLSRHLQSAFGVTATLEPLPPARHTVTFRRI